MNRSLMLAAIYGKTRLNFREVCKELNISYSTGRSWKSQGRMPVRMTGTPLAADVSELARYLDSLSEAPQDD